MWLLKSVITLLLAFGLVIGTSGCGDSSDDKKETNDGNTGGSALNEGTAAAPVLITIASGHTGSVGEHNGISYYKFTVAEASDLNLTITSTASSNISALIFSDAAFTSAVYSAGGGDFLTQHDFTYIQLDSAATYYLQINNNFDSTEAVTYTMAFGINQYNTDEGTAAAPIVLDSNTTHRASLGTFGTSYYQFEANTTGLYNILISNGTYSSSAPYYYVYSDSNFSNQVASSYSGSIVVAETGTYYFKVFNNENRGVSFDLVAGLSSLPQGDGSISEPQLVAIGSSNDITVDSNFASYYKFTVDNDGYYNITTSSYTTVTKNLYSDTLFSNEVTATSGAYQLTAGTTYYLKASSSSFVQPTLTISALNYGSSTGPVTLALDTENSGTIGITGTAYNNSYYSFTTGEAGDYTIVLKSTINSDLYLYDDAFTTQIASATGTDNTGETLVYTLQAATTYYVRVSTTSYSTPTYTIRALKTATASDGSVGVPMEITVNTPFDGNLTSSDVASYYSFAVPINQKNYNIFISDVSSHSNSATLTLYKDSGFTTQLGQTSSGSYPLHMELNTTAAYIKVTGASLPNNISYTLKVYEQISNEGATNALVPLTLGADHSAKVGTSSELSQYSFYKITLTEAGDYNFSSSGTSVDDLYQEVGKLSNIGYALKYSNSPSFVYSYRHGGSESFFLKTQNSADDTNLSYTLNVSKETAATATNEGTIASPITLPALARSGAKIGKTSQAADTSRYTFTSGANDGYYQATATNHSQAQGVTFMAYSDAGFTTNIGASSSSSTSNDYINIPVSGSTPYYLSAIGGDSYDVTFDLNINRISEGSATSPADVGLVNMGSVYQGVVGARIAASVSDISDESFYTFVDIPDTNFTITLTNVTGVNATDLRIRAYSDSAFSSTISTADGNLTFTHNSSPHYFKIWNLNTAANASYDISITGN